MDIKESTHKQSKLVLNIIAAGPDESSVTESMDGSEFSYITDVTESSGNDQTEESLSSVETNRKRKMNSSDEEYEVESILLRNRKERQYLIKWENFDWSAITWEPYSNIKQCTNEIRRLKERESVFDKLESSKKKKSRISMVKMKLANKCTSFINYRNLELTIYKCTQNEEPIYIYNHIDDDAVPEFKYIPDQVIHGKYIRYIRSDNSIYENKFNGRDENFIFHHRTRSELERSYSGLKCTCDSNPCLTKISQRGRIHKLLIGKTEDKSWSLFAGGEIKKGDFICKCAGSIILRNDIFENGYIFDINYLCQNKSRNANRNNFCIDTTEMGNECRFLNHSCDPNCYPQVITSKNKNLEFVEMLFFAKRDISFNEEITIDYFGGRLEFDKKESFIQCNCISPKCRKFVPANNSLINKYWFRQSSNKIEGNISDFMNESTESDITKLAYISQQKKAARKYIF
uniref:Histone-lysine N-methyltransferase n=1 Tax=Parastrongyloides trichosuri TaxID=131310 RepID=A0A0N4Z783_PARTI